MFRYRELAGDRKFRCAECGRVKRVIYVPISNLCRRCAARKAGEKRRSISNIPITLADNLVVTEAVEKRLRKKAESDIPLSRAEKLGNQISKWSILVFWASAYFAYLVARAMFPESLDKFLGVLLMGWAFFGPLVLIYIVDLLLNKPRKERAEQITVRLIELAEARKTVIEEAMRFYASPEWAAIRRQVIKEEGRTCEECRKRIKNDFDLTVDHKYPRSKYPDLELDRKNLRVLCRTCNSKKGTKLFDL